MILPFIIYAESFVTVPCEQVVAAYKQLEGFRTLCMVDPKEYFLKQKFENYEGNVTVDYVDGEDFNTTLNSSGYINAKIVPEKHFYLILGDYTSYKLKLSILSAGGESWKYFFPGTSRWRKYDLSPLTIQNTYPKITHGATQQLPFLITNRIIYGEGYPDHAIGDPFIGEVKLQGDDWKYIDYVTEDSNGTFTFNVTDRHEFEISAWDGKQWCKYPNRLSINIYDNLFESRDGKWIVIDSLDEAKLGSNLVYYSKFEPDEYTLNFKNISETSFTLNVETLRSNQGAKIIITTIPGKTYQFILNINKSVNMYFSDDNNGTYTNLRNRATLTGVDYDITVNSFKALGKKSYFYLAPQEIGELIVKNISMKVI